MSGSTWRGMHPERVHDIIGRLAQARADLTEAAGSADTAVNRLKGQWEGADAGAFFSGWPKLHREIVDAAGGVDALRKTLESEYEEQRRVSGAFGDTDGDGIPDRDDGDDDGDGQPDATDPDDDGDGTPDGEDPDEAPVKGGLGYNPFGGDSNRDYTDTSPTHRDDQDGTRERSDKSYRDDEGPTREYGSEHERHWGKDPNAPGRHEEGEHAGGSRFDAEANVNLVQGQYDHTFGPSGTLGDRDGSYLGYDIGSVHADGQAGFTLDKDGVRAGASASVAAMAASVSAQYKNSYGTTAQGKAYVGAEANADVGLGLGKNGVEAGAHAEAFAGGKAEGSVSQSVGPVDVGVGGEVSYGIGAHADIDAGITKDHVGVSVDIGATLGLGAGVKFDIGFDPPDLPDIDLNPFS